MRNISLKSAEYAFLLSFMLLATGCIAQNNSGPTTMMLNVGGSYSGGYYFSAQYQPTYNCQSQQGPDLFSIAFATYTSQQTGVDYLTLLTPAYPVGPGSYTATATFTGYTGAYGEGTSCAVGGSQASQVITIPMVTPILSTASSAQPIPQGEAASIPVAVNVPQPYATPEPPTGTLSLYYGSRNLAMVKVGVDATGQNGAASFSISTKGVSPGNYSVEVVYSGDANYYPATSSPFTLTVGPALAATTTQLSISPTTVILNEEVTLTAQVGPEANNVALTGAVSFTAGSLRLGEVNVTGGNAVIKVKAQDIPVGTYHVTASYSGDANYLPSSATITVPVVAKGATQVLFLVTPPTLSQGYPVTIVASVATMGGGNPTPTGTVTLTSGNTTLATLPLNEGEVVLQVSTFNLTPGTYPVTANYNGSSMYEPSSAGPDTVTVTPGVVMTVSASPNPVTQGQTAILTAQIIAQAGNGGSVPTGMVSFSYNGSTLGTATLNKGGGATLPIGTGGLPSGTDAISASYSGDGTFAAASGTISLVVQ